MRFNFRNTVFLMVLLSSLSLQAKDKKEKDPQLDLPKAVVYLKDGTTAEGFLENCEYRDEVVRLKPEARLYVKSKSYDIQQVDSVVSFSRKDKDARLLWLPVSMNLSYGNQSEKLLKHSALVLRIYHSAKMDAFMAFDDYAGDRILYKTPEMESAKSLHVLTEKLTDKRKKTLCEEFAAYPKFARFIQLLSKDALQKNPTLLIEKAGVVLNNSKASH